MSLCKLEYRKERALKTCLFSQSYFLVAIAGQNTNITTPFFSIFELPDCMREKNRNGNEMYSYTRKPISFFTSQKVLFGTKFSISRVLLH